MHQFILVLSLAIAATFSSHAPQAQAQADANVTPIVLRISKQLVEELTDDEILLDVPVSDEFAGIPISGVAKTRSKVKVTLETSNDTATFYLTTTGKGTTTLTGTAGPITVYGRAWTPYTLKTQVSFDGIKFTAHPVTAQVDVTSQIDSICTQRDGPVAMFIRHMARKKIDQVLPEMNAYLLARAKEGLESELAKVAADVVEELNEANQIDEMTLAHFPEAKSWKYHLAATNEFLLAAVGPKSATIPKLATSANTALPTSMDLWIKTTWTEALVLKAALSWKSTQSLLHDVLPPDIAKLVADDVKLTSNDGWFTIAIGHKAIANVLDELEKK